MYAELLGRPDENITFSADPALIEAAREKARAERTTLDAEFRRWLEDYSRTGDRVAKRDALMKRLREKVNTGGRKLTRDEMNER